MASQTARPASLTQVPHESAVLETVPPAPLGPPSAAARAFLPDDPDPYAAWRLPHSDEPAYVEPTESLARSAALDAARALSAKQRDEAEQAQVRG